MVVGIVIGALALVAALAAMTWANWVYGVVGIWGAVSPFALSFDADEAIWGNVIAGIVVIILAVVARYMGRQAT